MSFTRAQQGRFQPLWKQAWTAHCQRNAQDATDKLAQREWYEEQLCIAAGQASTTFLDAKRDFERVMAHFEAIVGESMFWSMRLYKGDWRRIAHEIRKDILEFDLDEAYVREMARKSLRCQDLPELSQLTYEQLAILMQALKRHLRRHHADDVNPF